MSPSKNTLIVIIIVAVLFIGVGIWVGVNLGTNRTTGAGLSPYSAVYLSTGDIYFGKLSWFPTPHLDDAWFLQRGTNANGQAMTGVYPFSQVAWGPVGTVYLDSRQIIFWTRLENSSTIAEAIANPNAAVTSQEGVPSVPPNVALPPQTDASGTQ